MLKVVNNMFKRPEKLFCITNEGRTVREEAAKELIKQIYIDNTDVDVYSGFKFNNPKYFLKHVSAKDAVVYYDNVTKRTRLIKGEALEKIIKLLKKNKNVVVAQFIKEFLKKEFES